MTLHWWMHWFWVTALLIITASSAKAYASPQSHDVHGTASPANAEIDETHAEREGRALYFSKPQAAPTKSAVTANATEKNQTDKTIAENKPNTTTDTPVQISHPSVIQWTPVNVTNLVNGTAVEVKNITNNNVTKTANNTTVTDVANATAVSNATLGAKTRNSTGIDVVKDDTGAEEAAERKIETLSLETTLVQTRLPPSVESSRRVIDHGDVGMDTGVIAGISFAAVVLAALAGSTAFVLYRRRYLNKPQTLNDKCSNPDSSGYLDDSTVRDNSEEMYSLDNDSFLNSLEAMTIQNYWTDTVKHTKL